MIYKFFYHLQPLFHSDNCRSILLPMDPSNYHKDMILCKQHHKKLVYFLDNLPRKHRHPRKDHHPPQCKICNYQ